MKIVDARVIVTCPGRNFVTLKIVTDGGLHGIGVGATGCVIIGGVESKVGVAITTGFGGVGEGVAVGVLLAANGSARSAVSSVASRCLEKSSAATITAAMPPSR